ncbi:coiled-coil domain-containing protein 55-domain containing protein [Rhodocollybia butyracea]|uniref:Coiled-coil domain-containing protein 55-domain containing protein n=1 Tax=Rhodocollybia butyracea TaxID=206335 RepID=A0A9P5PZD9_9AGAR|nr:coiled-coil domain-containing protein 55-domain containing protein [Rhodocollybia butyracea]
MEQEKKVDATVYEYDEVWDNMQQAKLRQKEAKESDPKKRQPKYINDLLNSSRTRKLDHLRAEEKMMQREREREGDEFADKESFVTQAYKDQMEEVRKAEEEEKKREELKRKQGGGSGMAHFYRRILEDSEQNHEATVAATQKPAATPQGPMPNMTITKPPDFAPISDLELARLAREEGKEVELNDDNQIIDKRDLLAGGLNLSGTNTRNLNMRSTGKPDTSSTENIKIHTAVGTAASRREINERRQREIEQQLEEERVRVQKEKEREEQEASQKIIAKRNNEEDVESARARYLERKRRKLEEAQGAAGE